MPLRHYTAPDPCQRSQQAYWTGRPLASVFVFKTGATADAVKKVLSNGLVPWGVRRTEWPLLMPRPHAAVSRHEVEAGHPGRRPEAGWLVDACWTWCHLERRCLLTWACNPRKCHVLWQQVAIDFWTGMETPTKKWTNVPWKGTVLQGNESSSKDHVLQGTCEIC